MTLSTYSCVRGSDDGELLMELRSAHAYPSLASAPRGRADVFVMDSGAGFHVITQCFRISGG